MLSKIDARNIADIVAKDPEASKRIASNIDEVIPASWGIAGGIRNAGYVALGIVTFGNYGDPTDPEYANRVCTGISDAASAALNKAVKSKIASLRNLIVATPISRELRGVAHTAVQLTMRDGQKHVADWHATLNAENPLLFQSPAKWTKDEGGITLEQFDGWK